jgi:hypothetical protein
MPAEPLPAMDAPPCAAPDGSERKERSLAGAALAVGALILGAAAMPLAVAYNQFLGVGLAGIGMLMASASTLIVIARRGAGYGQTLAGLVVSCSALFASVMLMINASSRPLIVAQAPEVKAEAPGPVRANADDTPEIRQPKGSNDSSSAGPAEKENINGESKRKDLSGTPPANDPEKEAAQKPVQNAGAVRWLPLTENERSRWKRMRAQVTKKFEAAVRKAGDPNDILASGGVILPGTPEEMRQQEAESKKQMEAWQKQRLDAARGRRIQYLAYSVKAKSWATVSVTVTFTNAGVRNTFVLGRNLPREKDASFGLDTTFTTYVMDNPATASKRAASIAALPDVRCVAVIELYSTDDPVLVRWVHDDGSGARDGVEPPFPDLVDELKQFVYRIQTTAE